MLPDVVAVVADEFPPSLFSSKNCRGKILECLNA